tara:strand:- start:1031 stop:1339 length:309 start_codon:yes stop_codon:yes gene_type:complete
MRYEHWKVTKQELLQLALAGNTVVIVGDDFKGSILDYAPIRNRVMMVTLVEEHDAEADEVGDYIKADEVGDYINDREHRQRVARRRADLAAKMSRGVLDGLI